MEAIKHLRFNFLKIDREFFMFFRLKPRIFGQAVDFGNQKKGCEKRARPKKNMKAFYHTRSTRKKCSKIGVFHASALFLTAYVLVLKG